jgi:peptide-methionine (S)-S-oxide reductase
MMPGPFKRSGDPEKETAMRIQFVTLLTFGVALLATTVLARDGGGAAPTTLLEKATFAGGCFWCMEPPFEKLDGVVSVVSGYTGGRTKNPTYEEVSSGSTGHAEAIEITFDPSKTGYARLLDIFWHNIDPTVKDRQFCDIGTQYRTAIFYHGEEQKRLAENSKKDLEQSGRFRGSLYTQIVPAAEFYPAEEYHQRYHEKNPIRYKFYRTNCGRDQRLKELWR